MKYSLCYVWGVGLVHQSDPRLHWNNLSSRVPSTLDDIAPQLGQFASAEGPVSLENNFPIILLDLFYPWTKSWTDDRHDRRTRDDRGWHLSTQTSSTPGQNQAGLAGKTDGLLANIG